MEHLITFQGVSAAFLRHSKRFLARFQRHLELIIMILREFIGIMEVLGAFQVVVVESGGVKNTLKSYGFQGHFKWIKTPFKRS